MNPNQNILKRRSSSFAYPQKLDKSVEISRLSTAVCSSKKGSTPKNEYKKYILDNSSKNRLFTDSSGTYLKSAEILAIPNHIKRRGSIIPQQLFTEPTTHLSNQSNHVSNVKNIKTNKNNKPTTLTKKQSSIPPKKQILRSQSVAKGSQQNKIISTTKKQEKPKKQNNDLQEKNVLRKKITRLTSQIKEEDERQKENEAYFSTNIASMKAKIGLIQQKRCLSEQKCHSHHETAKADLEQKTTEFYGLQQNYMQMYTNMVEKHHEDQVNWSLVYTNLLKDKTNLKKNVMIRQKLR